MTAPILSETFYKQVVTLAPRLCVSGVVEHPRNGIALIRRAVEPQKGKWHLPGGRIQKGDNIAQAMRRVIARELGLTVYAIPDVFHPIGVVENLSEIYTSYDPPLDIHNVDLIVRVLTLETEFKPAKDEGYPRWFREPPPLKEQHPTQFAFLKSSGFFT